MKKEKDPFFDGWLIMGLPDPDNKQWLYLGEATIQDNGTTTTWEARMSKGNDIIVHVMQTEQEAIGIKMLLAGTLTEADYKVLLNIGEKSGLSFTALQKLLPRNKKIFESINKFLRNNNIETYNTGGKNAHDQMHFKITQFGIETIKRYQAGENTMSGTAMKVISVKQALANEQAKIKKLTDTNIVFAKK